MQAVSASAGESFSCVAASEQQSGRLSQKALPGLKSVASATAAPASTRARPGGIGLPRKSALAMPDITKTFAHSAKKKNRYRMPEYSVE